MPARDTMQYFVARGVTVWERAAATGRRSDPERIIHRACFGEQTAQVRPRIGADLSRQHVRLKCRLNDLSRQQVLLKPTGLITMEFPHLLQLIEQNQFDTIYHEHFSYFSFLAVEQVFARHGMKLFDVEEIPTHGGSLRIYACHEQDASKPIGSRARALIEEEPPDSGC